MASEKRMRQRRGREKRLASLPKDHLRSPQKQVERERHTKGDERRYLYDRSLYGGKHKRTGDGTKRALARLREVFPDYDKLFGPDGKIRSRPGPAPRRAARGR